jgi:hypothetical protein
VAGSKRDQHTLRIAHPGRPLKARTRTRTRAHSVHNVPNVGAGGRRRELHIPSRSEQFSSQPEETRSLPNNVCLAFKAHPNPRLGVGTWNPIFFLSASILYFTFLSLFIPFPSCLRTVLRALPLRLQLLRLSSVPCDLPLTSISDQWSLSSRNLPLLPQASFFAASFLDLLPHLSPHRSPSSRICNPPP